MDSSFKDWFEEAFPHAEKGAKFSTAEMEQSFVAGYDLAKREVQDLINDWSSESN